MPVQQPKEDEKPTETSTENEHSLKSGKTVEAVPTPQKQTETPDDTTAESAKSSEDTQIKPVNQPGEMSDNKLDQKVTEPTVPAEVKPAEQAQTNPSESSKSEEVPVQKGKDLTRENLADEVAQ